LGILSNIVGADLCVCPRVNTRVNPYRVQDIAKQKGWGDYLIDNATVALQALDLLEIKYNINSISIINLNSDRKMAMRM